MNIKELVKTYFKQHPNEELTHAPVVDWVTKEYLKTHPSPPRDPWRTIRGLYQDGFLVKVRKGVYKYDPELEYDRELEGFSVSQREIIFERDGYKCVICGLGRADGLEIHADHIIPKERGGKATIENGQTLCSKHNIQKKHYKQTESGKRMFIRLYELSKQNNDDEIRNFCEQILEIYEANNVNGHIVWKR